MKKILAAVLCVCALVCLTGCNFTTSKAFTFNVSTGDMIRIELDTADGYSITSDIPFTISCDGETLTQGKFITLEGYELYEQTVNADEKSTLLGVSTKDGNEYIHWAYLTEEFNYIIKVKDSNTAILLYNGVSEKSAKECFERLTITKEN